MILNNEHLNERISVQEQEKELERIKSAHYGEVLFTVGMYADTDVVETLLYKSGVEYHEGVGACTVKFYKGAHFPFS